MIAGKDIEILMLTDNKHRTIGEKRENLKNISKGIYWMFVDDDDDLVSVEEIYDYIHTELHKPAGIQDFVDVITFKQKCRNASGSEYIVTFGLGNEIEHKSDGNGNYVDIKRPPFHVCAWHENFKRVSFSFENYGEDGTFVIEANKWAKTEYFIDKVIHSYNFDQSVTEAFDPVKAPAPMKSEKTPTTRPRAIVNYVTYNERYVFGQKRLKDSLTYINQYLSIPITYHLLHDFPPTIAAGYYDHNFIPYGFKISIIEDFFRHCDKDCLILWLDASVVCVKDPQPVFDWIVDHEGLFMEHSGHMVGSWCNDRTLEYFGINREEAMQMPMFSAGFVGFDFTQPTAVEFFKRWKKSRDDGYFAGSWDDHRHDMTCGSIIANQMGLVKNFSPGGQFFAYVGPGYEKPKSTAVFELHGI